MELLYLDLLCNACIVESVARPRLCDSRGEVVSIEQLASRIHLIVKVVLLVAVEDRVRKVGAVLVDDGVNV